MTMVTILTLCSVLGTSPVEEPKDTPATVSDQVEEITEIKDVPVVVPQKVEKTLKVQDAPLGVSKEVEETPEFQEVSKTHHVLFSTGVSEIHSKEIYWFGGKQRPLITIDYSYDYDEFLPGFALGASLAHEQGEGDFDLALTELSLNALYQWPNNGWAGVVFPYARVSALATMVTAQGNSDVDWVDENFVPGLAAALGAHIGFGRLASTDRLHWMATVEMGYALRATTLIRLRPNDEENEIEPIRIGDINLSGTTFKVGIGFEF